MEDDSRTCFYFPTKSLAKEDAMVIEQDIEKQSKVITLHNLALMKTKYPFTIKHKEVYTKDNTNILKKLGYYILC